MVPFFTDTGPRKTQQKKTATSLGLAWTYLDTPGLRIESSKTIPGGTFGSQRLLGTVFLGLGNFSAYRRNVRNLEEPFVLSVY